MHYEVLDEKRRALLPALVAFKDDFYLAGGTALALQIGHRVSVDFDFFTESSFEPGALYERVRNSFGEAPRTQESVNTLAVVVEGDVRMSFMTYRYPLLEPCIDADHLRLASLADIGCMKLGAIVSRAELKDYVDLFFILKSIPLSDLLTELTEKTPSLDRNLVLKALVSFDDIPTEPIAFLPGNEIPIEEIRAQLIDSIKTLS